MQYCRAPPTNPLIRIIIFFFFNDTATTEIYTLSLHDALPICLHHAPRVGADLGATRQHAQVQGLEVGERTKVGDRKSTRLNSSHGYISYAVFCLKKKKKPRSPQHNKLQTSYNHPNKDYYVTVV